MSHLLQEANPFGLDDFLHLELHAWKKLFSLMTSRFGENRGGMLGLLSPPVSNGKWNYFQSPMSRERRCGGDEMPF